VSSFALLIKHFLSDEIEVDETGKACSMYGGGRKKMLKGFGWEILMKEITWKTQV